MLDIQEYFTENQIFWIVHQIVILITFFSLKKGTQSEDMSIQTLSKLKLKPLQKKSGYVKVNIEQIILAMHLRKMIRSIEEGFSKHEPDSPILMTLWHTMMLMAVFREDDWRSVRSLFLNFQEHEQFVYDFMKFQMPQSELRGGFFWVGSLKSVPQTLWQDILNKGMSNDSKWMKEIYRRFDARLDGEW